MKKKVSIFIAVEPVNEALPFMDLFNTKEYRLVKSSIKNITLFHESCPELILLDSFNFNVWKQIKMQSEIVDIPVIFISTDYDQEKIKDAFNFGASDFIHTSLNKKEIQTRIDIHVNRFHSKHKKLQNESFNPAYIEDNYRSLINSLPLEVVIHQDTKILFANKLLRNKLQFDSKDIIIGKCISEFINAKNKLTINRKILQIQEQKSSPVIHDIQLSGKNNIRMDADAVSTKIKYKGKPAVLTCFFDITKMKAANELLEQNLIEINETEKIVHIGNWEMNIETGKSTWSDEFYRICGLKPKEIEASSEGWITIIHPDDRDSAQKDVSAAIENNSAYHVEIRIVRPNGEIRNIMSFGHTLKKNNGRTVLKGGILDITDRKKAEEENTELNKNLGKAVIRKTKELYESESQFRSAFETTALGMFLLSPNGNFMKVNESLSTMTGYDRIELISNPINSIICHSTIDDFEQQIKNLKHNNQNYCVSEIKFIHKSGLPIWIFLSVSKILDRNNTILYFVGQAFEITKRKISEDTMKASLTINKMLDNNSINEIMNYSIETAAQVTNSKIGYFHFLSEDEKIINIQTWTKETKLTCKIPDKEHLPIDKAGIWIECIKMRLPVMHNDYEFMPNKKGLPSGHIPLKNHLSVPVFEKEKIVAIIGVGNKSGDYTEFDIRQLQLIAENAWHIMQRKHSEKTIGEMLNNLEKLATVDYLTNIYNRRYMNDKINDEIKRYKRNKTEFSLIMGDIDLFKKFNDNYGHDCGDYILVSLCKTIQIIIREQDTLARWGGEEFLIILPHTKKKGAHNIAERIRKEIESTKYQYENQLLTISMTFGTAEYQENSTIEDTLKQADNNLYIGKESGRNCVIT